MPSLAFDPAILDFVVTGPAASPVNFGAGQSYDELFPGISHHFIWEE
jgi:hypothetical protein